MQLIATTAKLSITVDNGQGQEVLAFAADNVQTSLDVTQGLLGLTRLVDQFQSYLKLVDAPVDHAQPSTTAVAVPSGERYPTLVLDSDIIALVEARHARTFERADLPLHVKDALSRVIDAIAHNHPITEIRDGHEIKL
jgi:hypothetical protein